MQEKLENVLASATIPWQIIDSCCYHLYHFQEIAKCLRSVEQFIQTVKGQNNFW